ncbi:MAG: dihydroneopterin aldolase [Chloroflexota bacterium]
MAAVTDRITLRGMRFAGRHGVTAAEREAAQPFEVDVVVRLDLSRPAATDDLADTIDYSTIFEVARQIVEERSFHLIEALAGAIADAILANPAVDDVEVRVRKPKAPLPGAFETVEARLRRRRDPATG